MCHSEEEITVKAGTYSAYLIVPTVEELQFINLYYASEVKNIIKFEITENISQYIPFFPDVNMELVTISY